MPRTVPEQYFQTGIFANTLPGELFRTYTCLGCGHRATTWAAFTAHRPACSGHLWSVPVAPTAPEERPPRRRGDRVDGGFVLSVDDLDHLASLAAQLPDAQGGGGGRTR